MGRLFVVSFQQYRTYQLELRDAGGAQCAVIIHPRPAEAQRTRFRMMLEPQRCRN
ncbi:hypothetical protein ACFQU7_41825 [Pseudoroseomonas wenyumeiae]